MSHRPIRAIGLAVTGFELRNPGFSQRPPYYLWFCPELGDLYRYMSNTMESEFQGDKSSRAAPIPPTPTTYIMLP